MYSHLCHSLAHTYIHIYTLADGVGEEVEDALQLIVSTVEQSARMMKDQKQMILDTLSTLRDLIVKLHVSRES